MNGGPPGARAARPGDERGSGDDLIYRSVLDSVASGVVSLDSRGVVKSFNAAAEEIVGLKREAVIGHTFQEVFAQQAAVEAFADAILDAVYESSIVDRVVEATFAGRARTLSVATRYLREERGGETVRLGVVAVFTDISEIKELRETEIRLGKEMAAQHAELLDAYRDQEETNRRLSRVSKRMNVVRLGAGLGVLALFVAVGIYYWDAGAHFGPRGAASAGAALRLSRKTSMSCLLTRPPSPVPGTSVRSTPCSRAMRRTSGELRGWRRTGSGGASSPSTGGAGASGAGSTGASPVSEAPSGAAAPAASGASPGDQTSPSAAIRPTTEFTVTVSPSGTRISTSRPVRAAGTSVSTLSVAMSKRGSSRSTVSPTAARHLVIVPSVMLSPIWGMMMSLGTSGEFYCGGEPGAWDEPLEERLQRRCTDRNSNTFWKKA